MITLKQRILAGLLLSLVVVAAAGVSPIQAHRSASLGITPCRSCTVPIPLSIQSAWLLRSGADPMSFEPYVSVVGSGFTPYYQVYGEAVDTTTNTAIYGTVAWADGNGNVEVDLYPSPIDGSNYNVCVWNSALGACDPLWVRLYDVVTQRWTGLYPATI